MSLTERLEDEMRSALRSRDKLRLSVVRMARAAVKNKEIEERKKLDDGAIIKVISGLVKKGEESLVHFQQANRLDLIEKEEEELRILRSFLPQQLSRDEILALVDEATKETDAIDMKDLGKVMKSLMPKTAGRADGKIVHQLVRGKLSH
ncbi:MAG: GatB/YqeY domain-containing protein [Deltaproteobacteria bacterium]|nr:GatB/YqeY domain-containing protein [Deltaproteobacteria bacterium]